MDQISNISTIIGAMLMYLRLNPLIANPTKWSTHTNNSSATADELVQYVRPFCGVGA